MNNKIKVSRILVIPIIFPMLVLFMLLAPLVWINDRFEEWTKDKEISKKLDKVISEAGDWWIDRFKWYFEFWDRLMQK